MSRLPTIASSAAGNIAAVSKDVGSLYRRTCLEAASLSLRMLDMGQGHLHARHSLTEPKMAANTD